jgi:hypothetical protein
MWSMKVETPYSLLSHTWFSNWLLKIIEKFILIRLVLLLLLSKKISTNDIHLGWRVGVSRTILKVDHLKIFSTKQQILMWFFLSQKYARSVEISLKKKFTETEKSERYVGLLITMLLQLKCDITFLFLDTTSILNGCEWVILNGGHGCRTTQGLSQKSVFNLV